MKMGPSEVRFVAETPEVNASATGSACGLLSFMLLVWSSSLRGDLLGGARPSRGAGSVLGGTMQPLAGLRGEGVRPWGGPCDPLHTRQNGGRHREEHPALSVSASQGRAAPCDWLFSPSGRVKGHGQPMGSAGHFTPLHGGSENPLVPLPSGAMAAMALSVFLPKPRAPTSVLLPLLAPFFWKRVPLPHPFLPHVYCAPLCK